MLRKRLLVGMIAGVLSFGNALWATVITTALHCSADTFVYCPGDGAAWTKALAEYGYGTGNNFGGSGSMSVAAVTAAQEKGEFDSLLKYDFSSLSGLTVTNMTLTLNLSCGNSGGYSIFNTYGSTGYFDISWFSSSWVEGVDAAHTGTYTSGITYDSLQTLLASDPATYLQTFYFDNVAGSHTFALDLTSGNYSSLLSAITAGDTITLLLTASDGSSVSFNLTGNNNAYMTITAIPEPATMFLLMAGCILAKRTNRNRNRRFM